MASTKRQGGMRRLSLVLALVGLFAPGPAHALKVVTWNLLGYDDSPSPNPITPRQPLYRLVMADLDPDIVFVQELLTASAADSFLIDVLNVVQPGEWTRGPFILSTPSSQGCVFFKPARVNVTSTVALNEGGPRAVLLCVVKPVGYLTNPGWFRLYSVHFKAGNPSFTPSDSTARRIECNNLRNAINSLTSQGSNFIVGGDTNFYSSFEPGYVALTESRGGTNGNAGRCNDVLGAAMAGSVWNSNPAFAGYDTQSPCAACPSYPNVSFANGGMDDRFDIVFTSYSLADGQGVDRIDYYAYGQDGHHFNTDINAAPTNTAVGQTLADALWGASDHLPTVAVLQLASRVVAASQVDFGAVIVGANVQQTLSVTDGGAPPVDPLDYFFATVPAGFTAPPGPFSVTNGSTNLHTLGMSTATAGILTGTLIMTTDDPDSLDKGVKLSGTVLDHAQPSLDSLVSVLADSLDWGDRPQGSFSDSLDKGVKLSGTVLDHAQPSLDSLVSVLADSLDWGDRPQGSFSDSLVEVFNLGHGALRARLDLTGAALSGGSGRFSLMGPTFPSLAEDRRPLRVHFDDTNVTSDSAFVGVLTVSTADEALPGATALAPLTVTLRARVTGTTGVEEIPRVLAFLAPRPNPLSTSCQLGFDLPLATHVELAIYDLAGRRVSALASGVQTPGHHLVWWNAADDAGNRVGAGIYFARFLAGGVQRTARMAVLP